MKQKLFLLLLALCSTLLASRWLLTSQYYPVHDDFQVMRQLQMEKCWRDGQIPCRWVPDMGYGYGYPLFNYYPPLPCYVGQFFRLFGSSFVTTQNLTFALQFFVSAIAMFVLASDLWGPWGGLLSAVLYTWAPYRAVEVFVRGSLNEAWVLVWVPLILWASKKLIVEEKVDYLVWLTFSLAALFLTHAVLALTFLPMLAIWILYWIVAEQKHFRKIGDLLARFSVAGVWSLGLSAFFTVPMLFEISLVHVENMFYGWFQPQKHLASLNQLLVSRFWGWGGSEPGYDDAMSFQIGHAHWVLAILVFSLALLSWLRTLIQKKRTDPKERNGFWLIALVFAMGAFYSFLIHARSAPIWEVIEPLRVLQFPWRLLAEVALLFSLLGGATGRLVKNRPLILALCLAVAVINWSYFRPQYTKPWSDSERFAQDWDYLQSTALYDYLPRTVQVAPTAPPGSEWLFLDGEARAEEFRKGTNWLLWKGDIKEAGRLQVSVFYFPNWKAWIDDRAVEVSYDERLGTMQVLVPGGKHEIYFRLTDTPIRAWANLLSLLSWSVFVAVIAVPKFRQLASRLLH